MGLIYPEVKVWLVVAMGGSGSGGGGGRHRITLTGYIISVQEDRKRVQLCTKYSVICPKSND